MIKNILLWMGLLLLLILSVHLIMGNEDKLTKNDPVSEETNNDINDEKEKSKDNIKDTEVDERKIKKKVLEDYYTFLMSGEFEKSYELLSEKSKKGITKKRYVEIQKLEEQIDPLVSFRIKEEIDNNEFIVQQSLKSIYKYGKIESGEFIVEVVKEDGEWKYNRKEERLDNSWNNRIIENHFLLSKMYEEGLGKEENQQKSKEHYEKAINLLNHPNDKLFFMATVASVLENYEEALEYFDKFIDKSEKDELKVIAYFNMAAIHLDFNELEEAHYHIEELLKIDPGNEEAQVWLEELLYYLDGTEGYGSS